MKKKMLLLGALAILSTAALGASATITELDSWVSGLHNVTVKQAQGSYEKTSSMIESAKKLGVEVIRDTPTGPTDMAKFANGFKVNDKAQAQVFDKTVDIIATNKKDIAINKGSIEKNKNTIADLSSVVASKASVSDVNAAKDQANSAMGIAIDNTGKINNATDGMIASASKLGITVETVEANSKYLEAGKVQAEIFDKTVDVVAKNKNDITGIDGKVESNSQLISGNQQRVESVENISDSNSKRINAAEGSIGDAKTKIEENRLQINTNKDLTDEAISANTDKIDANKSIADRGIIENKTAIKEAGKRVDETEASISEIKSDFSKHTLEAEKRDKIQDEHIEKLKEADVKFADADKKFAETDQALQEKDKKIEANIAKLHNHDSAIYEEGMLYAEGAEPRIKAVVNRERIEALEGSTRDTQTQINANTTGVATNKAKTEENEGKIAINSQQIDQALKLADNNSEHIEKNSKRIDGLEKKVDGLESKMNKGLAMAAATSSIVYPHLGKGDLGIGAGIGGYGGSQAIAIGVAMQPTENVRINTNVSTSDTSDTMYGAGVGYKFNIFGS